MQHHTFHLKYPLPNTVAHLSSRRGIPFLSYASWLSYLPRKSLSLPLQKQTQPEQTQSRAEMAILLCMQKRKKKKRAISEAHLCPILFECEWPFFSPSNPMVYLLELFWWLPSLAVPELPISSAVCRARDLYPTGLVETWLHTAYFKNVYFNR